MTPFRLSCITLVCCGLTAADRAEGRSVDKVQIYKYIERLDPVSGKWHALNAIGRITTEEKTIRIAIWHTWGDERINPLLKIELSTHPEWDTTDGTWSYRGRTAPSYFSGKDCQLKSCTKIANTHHSDFTVIVSGRPDHYRMSRKNTAKP